MTADPVATPRDPSVDRGIALATLAATASLSLLVWLTEMPDPPAGPVQALGLAVVPLLYLGHHQRRRSRAERRQTAISRDDTLGIRPIVVCVILAVALLLIDSSTGAVIGTIVDLSMSAAGVTSPEAAIAALGTASLLFGIPIIASSSFFAGRRASFYLPPKHLRWLLAAVVITVASRTSIIVVSRESLAAVGVGGSTTAILVYVLPTAGLMLVCVVLGSLFGRRKREAVILARRFRLLDRDDQMTVLELMRGSVTSIP